ncbi:MAG: pentapeptide repeat-containing protein [Xanthobacteraceae bacterium]
MADEEDIKRLRDGERDLTRSDFRKANLSGADLRDRDFSDALFDNADLSKTDFRGSSIVGASLTGATFNGANLAGVRFPQSLVAVSFEGANLVGASFANCNLGRANFAGADIRGTQFTYVSFIDNNDFTDAVFDTATDFEKATGLRYLSRVPVFQNFNYDRGVFTRKPNVPTASEGADAFNATIEVRDPPRNSPSAIEKRIAISLPEVRGLAASLALAIDGHIQTIEAAKPNEVDALARHQSQVEFLQQISVGLQDISTALADLGSDVGESIEGVTRASRIAADLSEKLESWVAKNGETLVGSTINVGMIAAASTLFWICGAHAPFGFAVATAVVGGKPVVENVKGLIDAWKKGSH